MSSKRRKRGQILASACSHILACGVTAFAIHSQSQEFSSVSITNSTCIFDDTLFRLSLVDKAELRAQLTGVLSLAVKDLQRDVWLPCAEEGGFCSCKTMVRYGHPGIESRGYTALADLHDGGTECKYQGILLDEKKLKKRCECLQTYKLRKKMASSSLLQEALIVLLRFTAKSRLMPVTGDPNFSGNALWTVRRPDPDLYGLGWIDRVWGDRFIQEVSRKLDMKGAACLEWGLRRLPQLQQCSTLYDFLYSQSVEDFGISRDSDLNNKPRFWVKSDVLRLSDTLAQHGTTIDLILAEQVFEHLKNPFEAAIACFHALNPGGALLITVPHGSQFHTGEGYVDFFRFTKHGLLEILTSAGFCVRDDGVYSGGDFIFEAARNLGLGYEDFRMSEICSAFREGFDYVSHGATNIMAIAYKPPHSQC